MNDPYSKYDLLRKYTTSSSVIDALCGYTENKFVRRNDRSNDKVLPTFEEESIPVWEDYFKQSKETGVFEVLKRNLVQLQFPIRKNSSQSVEYRAATIKGVSTDEMTIGTGLKLKEAGSLDFFIYHGFAGKIPVIVTANNEDFVSLVQALTYRNEPVQIPESMGAALINGLNNWDKIRRLKEQWLKNNPFGNWSNEFRNNVFPNTNLYQDKLIILSKKPYSSVPAEALGLTEEDWLKQSLKIRLEHECSHLFTLKAFGCMANNMHDELIADYMGISRVKGKFRSDWFLRFIGLENYPEYRSGGRLENYLSVPQLSNQAVAVLRTILRNAAVNLEAFDDRLGLPSNQEDRIYRLHSICSLDLVEMSLEKGKEKLLNQYQEICQMV